MQSVERYAIPAEKSLGSHRSGNRDLGAAGRVTVVRNQHLVPLLGSVASQTRREQPWKGVLLEKHLVQPSEIPEHEHPQLCLHLQLGGEEDFEWWSSGRNALEHTQAGSLILIPPGTRDRLRWQGASERLIISVNPGDLTGLAQDFGMTRVPEFRAKWSLYDHALRQILKEMGREASIEWPLGSLYADLMTMGLKTQLLRSHTTDPLRMPPLKGGLSLPS